METNATPVSATGNPEPFVFKCFMIAILATLNNAVIDMLTVKRYSVISHCDAMSIHFSCNYWTNLTLNFVFSISVSSFTQLLLQLPILLHMNFVPI